MAGGLLLCPQAGAAVTFTGLLGGAAAKREGLGAAPVCGQPGLLPSPSPSPVRGTGQSSAEHAQARLRAAFPYRCLPADLGGPRTEAPVPQRPSQGSPQGSPAELRARSPLPVPLRRSPSPLSPQRRDRYNRYPPPSLTP